MTVLKLIARCLLPVAVLFLISCAPGKQGLMPSRVIPATADEILKNIEDWQRRVYSLRGMASVEVVAGGRDANVREVIVVKRPDKIRAETIGIFGIPLLAMSINGSNVAVQSGNKFYKGDIESSEGMLPFPFDILKPREVADLLLGSTPVIRYESMDLRYMDTEKSYILTLNSPDASVRQEISVDAESLRLKNSEIIDRRSGTVLSLTFNNYQEIEDVSFPKEIKARFSHRLDTGKTDYPDALNIAYEGVELNKDIEDELFILTPPENSIK